MNYFYIQSITRSILRQILQTSWNFRDFLGDARGAFPSSKGRILKILFYNRGVLRGSVGYVLGVEQWCRVWVRVGLAETGNCCWGLGILCRGWGAFHGWGWISSSRMGWEWIPPLFRSFRTPPIYPWWLNPCTAFSPIPSTSSASTASPT